MADHVARCNGVDILLEGCAERGKRFKQDYTVSESEDKVLLEEFKPGAARRARDTTTLPQGARSAVSGNSAQGRGVQGARASDKEEETQEGGEQNRRRRRRRRR